MRRGMISTTSSGILEENLHQSTNTRENPATTTMDEKELGERQSISVPATISSNSASKSGHDSSSSPINVEHDADSSSIQMYHETTFTGMYLSSLGVFMG